MRVLIFLMLCAVSIPAYSGLIFIDPSNEITATLRIQIERELKNECPRDFFTTNFEVDAYWMYIVNTDYRIIIESDESKIEVSFQRSANSFTLDDLHFRNGSCR